jgi:predicted ATPase/class 3 adenylate cyclase
MDSLLAFIPEDRRLALAGVYSLADRSNGAVLFADISGFTPLTAALAQELGIQRGAEEVLNQINPVYEAIIARLHHYGGSVMGFAGDSITCWLEGDNGHKAVACSLAMQEAMRPFATVRTPAGTPVNLAIKVAVTAGPTRRFVVGNPNIQLIDVLAGRTLDHVASAEKLAEKGEVVVGEEIVTNLGAQLELVEWRTSEQGERFAVVSALKKLPDPAPHAALPDDSLVEDKLKEWILPPVYRRLQSGETFLAELRPAVALFLKFSGIDYDGDDQAGDKLNTFVQWLQNIVNDQEGFLIQLTMGDKGSYAYAGFGAPVAHDDDGVRAVTAALALRNPPPVLSYIHDIQIGISRGRVWVGACGAKSRHTYGVMGNEVNMAARLMGKADPGQILVRRRIADEAKQSFQFAQLGLMSVKGGAEPIPVAELVGRQHGQILQGTQFEFPLVGRESELAQLVRLLDGVLAGRGQIITLQGSTGIGKSHLTWGFQQQARANGFQVAVGASQRVFQATTYFPWQQILRQIIGLETGPASDQSSEEFTQTQIDIVEQTLRQINPDWQVRIPLLGDILGIPIPENPTTAAFDPKQRQESLFAFIVDIIRSWARAQPLLLVFDNAQWMDDISQTLLEALAKRVDSAPVMILIATRPASETENKQDVLTSLGEIRNHQLIRLRELNSSGSEQLVVHLLGSRPSLLAQLLIEAKAHGNPFFIRELVDSLRESGQLIEEEDEWILSAGMINSLRAANALVRDDDKWILADAADLSVIALDIPDSVHGVILARLDRLPDSHKPTIKVASVIGYTFELGLLAQAHPAHPHQTAIQTQATALEERDFIIKDWTAESKPAEFTYTFRQQATQEVSYETLLFTQRRELHCNLAELLEQQAPDEVDQIAYHSYLGEDWDRSLRYQFLAGTRDKQLFANLQSIDHFRKALNSADHLPEDDTLSQRQKINADLGELLLTLGEQEEALTRLHAALSLAEQLEDVEAQAHACRWIARSFEFRGQYEPALEWIDRGLSILADRVTPSSLELRLIGGLIYSRRGEYKIATEQALGSLIAAQELGEQSIIARAHNLLGTIYRLRSRLPDSIKHIEEALSLYREIGNLQGQALAQNSLANVYFDLGMWSEAENFYSQAGKIFSQLGNVYNRLLIDNNNGGIALNQGRLDEALHYYHRALKAIEQIGGSLWVVGGLHLNLGATYIRRREIPVAFDHLNKSRELFEEAQVRDLLPEMHRRMAEAYIAQNEYEAAMREAEESISQATELAMTAEQGHALRVRGVINATREQYVAAENDFSEAINLLKQVGDDYGLALTQLELARLYFQWDEFGRCHTLVDEILPTFERLGASIEVESARSLIPVVGQP